MHILDSSGFDNKWDKGGSDGDRTGTCKQGSQAGHSNRKVDNGAGVDVGEKTRSTFDLSVEALSN